MKRDPYSVLGVCPGASKEEIRRAYLMRIRAVHPDRLDPKKDHEAWEYANSLAAEINEAYNELKNRTSRRPADQTTSEHQARSEPNRSSDSGETGQPDASSSGDEDTCYTPYDETPRPESVSSVLWALLSIAFVGWLTIAFVGGLTASFQQDPNMSQTTTADLSNSATDSSPTPSTPRSYRLPNGQVLRFAAGTTDEQIRNYLQDHYPPIDAETQPSTPAEGLRTNVASAQVPAESAIEKGEQYIVARGDTLSIIANRAGVSMNRILAFNDYLPSPHQIFAGQEIWIPKDDETIPDDPSISEQDTSSSDEVPPSPSPMLDILEPVVGTLPARDIATTEQRPPTLSRQDNMPAATDVRKSHFTIGSLKSEVIHLQGTPTSIHKYQALGHEVWRYGLSNVEISTRNGRVTQWSNHGNLKVILLPGRNVTGATHFTEGSHKDDVIRLQGTPTSIHNYQALGHEVWRYGLSNVEISTRNDRVTQWNNHGNLKVILLPGRNVTGATHFTEGSHKDDVIRLQGTPTSIHKYPALGHEVWRYGLSNVEISTRNGRVRGWNNNGNLKVRISSIQ